MSIICTKCGHDPRTDFPVGCSVRYWALAGRVVWYTPCRVVFRSVCGCLYRVSPSSLVRVPDDALLEYGSENRHTAVNNYLTLKSRQVFQCEEEQSK